MLSRIQYAIKACWLYKKQLKHCLLDPSQHAASLIQITPANILQRGVKALVLDFDGVMASHAEPIPRKEVVMWLRNFESGFVGQRIYILSNKPTKSRLDYFAQSFPEIIFIIAKRKKPYPDGLLQIISESGLHPQEILLVDDRLATGIVAAVGAGVQYILITKPYIDFRARPLSETFFMVLRFCEKLCIGKFIKLN